MVMDCRSVLCWAVFASLIRGKGASELKELTLGVALPWSGGVWDVAPRFAAGISIAVQNINKDGSLLPGYHVSFVWRNSRCMEKDSMLVIVDMYTEHKVNAIIGPACSNGCKLAAILGEHWNIPVVSYGCAASYLSYKSAYPNFARTVGIYQGSGKIMAQLMKRYGWKKLAILTPTSDVWMDIVNDVRKDIENEQLELSYFQSFDEDTVEDNFMRIRLLEAKQYSHVFLLGGYTRMVSRVMVQARHLGMHKGFVFVSYELLLGECRHTPEEKHCQALEGLLDISLSVPNDSRYEKFAELVREEMSKQPFNHQMKQDEKVENYAAFLHDAALLYAYALNKTLDQGGSVDQGRVIVRNMLNSTLKGASGLVSIDANGDRQTNLQLKNVQKGKYERVGSYNADTNKLDLLKDISWPGGGFQAPLGRPRCGFANEFCPPTDPWIYAGAGIVTTLLTVALGAAILLKHKKNIFEAALQAQSWKINFKDISFYNERARWQSVMSNNNNLLIKRLNNSRNDVRNSLYVGSSDARIGLYQGNYVAVKKLNQGSVTLTREILMELKLASEIQHQNINLFVGACVEAPNVCLVTKYCNKGSLQDALYNLDVQLDWLFKTSLAMDIARGMEYLHGCAIGVHGRLKSSNCLVDNRWVCKLADYGLFCFHDREKQFDYDEDYRYSGLLWTAPEHIDNKEYSCSQPGDVYSFGVIMNEIISREFPYENYQHLSFKEKVVLVKTQNHPLFRPLVSGKSGNMEYCSLLQACWSYLPSDRPSFEEINKKLKKLNGGKNVNIVDNMLNMMEKYSNNLEELVSERTGLLEEEKSKTNDLLYKMLPKCVADQLKQGNVVQAESYDSVTIFFSDVVGFTKLASRSTPMQVVEFLNDLYTCFDTICDTYNVYKVETIGDAYMVASGLPVRCGREHAGEIARMSLHLLHASTTFTIRHCPQTKLQLRIGIHSGPVVTGVVGMKMPRYCLFGDTVNYASRMESTGTALRIHVSPECRQLLECLGGFQLVERGPVTMKGKGTITTYFLLGHEGFDKSLPVIPDHDSLTQT